ncbi:MAG: hypothetical protein JRI80_01380 [Deltaproteobacteria bacterium]|nr:hypothetical protein [Deltaproteobacteria bacterium]
MDRLLRQDPDTGARPDFLAGFGVLPEDTAGASAEAGVLAVVLVAEAVIAVGERGKLNIYPAHCGESR